MFVHLLHGALKTKLNKIVYTGGAAYWDHFGTKLTDNIIRMITVSIDTHNMVIMNEMELELWSYKLSYNINTK